MNNLFSDLKTDQEKSAFFLSGRGYETGVIAPAIQNDVAMAYHRCAEYEKEVQALRKDAERYRWMRNESWAGYNSGSGKPRVAETIVITQDGAGNVKTILAEDALDAAIDAAMEKQK